MGKAKDLSAFDRGKIIEDRQVGHSTLKIVRALGFSRVTVPSVYREYINSGKTISAKTNRRGKQHVDE